MDTFTAFSTSPGVVAAAMQNGRANAELDLSGALSGKLNNNNMNSSRVEGTEQQGLGGAGAAAPGAAFSTLAYHPNSSSTAYRTGGGLSGQLNSAGLSLNSLGNVTTNTGAASHVVNDGNVSGGGGATFTTGLLGTTGGGGNNNLVGRDGGGSNSAHLAERRESNPLFFSTAPNVNAMAHAPSSVLSTLATALPPQTTTNTNAMTSFSALDQWSRYGTLHISATMNCNSNALGSNNNSAGSGAELDKSLEYLKQTLQRLQQIAEGGDVVLPNWDELIVLDAPVESAQRLNVALDNLITGVTSADPTATLTEAYTALATRITSPAHLPMLLHLSEQHRNAVRNHVLEELLTQLMKATTPFGMQLNACVEMLAAMARYNLVLLSGVAAMVGQFLSDPGTRAVGMRVLGRMASEFRTEEAFLQAMRDVKDLDAMLWELYKDPLYEPDVVSVMRLLSGTEMGAAGSAGTTLRAVAQLAQPTPTCAMHYMPSTDLLLSAQCDGTVCLWGSPTSNNNNAKNENSIGALQEQLLMPQHILELAPGRLPVAIASSSYSVSSHSGAGRSRFDGNNTPYVVVADMPVFADGACACYTRTHGSMNHTGSPSSHTGLPTSMAGQHAILHILRPRSAMNIATATTTTELSGNNENIVEGWHEVAQVERPANVVVTALTVVSNEVFCVAESGGVGEEEEGGAEAAEEEGINASCAARQHALVYFSSTTTASQPLRRIANAHTDYVTVLTCGDEAELPGPVLLSGSRDATVKVWDMRANAAHAGTLTPTPASPYSTTNTVNVAYSELCAMDIVANASWGQRHSTLEASMHRGTISALCPWRNYVFSGSLDGTVQVWDLRQTTSAVTGRSFPAPVLGLTALDGNHMAVATARGLYLLSCETMGAIDVVPNVAYTQLCVNDAGNLLFAASEEGVAVFTL